MATEVLMPKLGLTMTEGTIEEWKFKEGDTVKKGDILFSVATDKLTNDVEAEEDGTLLKILLPEGETAPCKSVIAWIGAAGEAVPDAAGAAAPAAPAPAAPAAPAPAAAPAAAGQKTVIVVGGGPGGYVAAIRAAQLGAKVTLVEREHIGGTCLNIGCIPTKCLLHSAELVSEIKEQGADIGVKVSGVEVDFPQVIAHKNAISKQLTQGVAGLLKQNKVARVDGEASFTGPKTLSVKKSDGSVEEMTADAIIVATGSVNAQPPIPGLKENPNCIDSTGALSLEKLPKSMVVIGGGVIGLELACAYAAFGTKITVVEALDHMLPMLDGDLTAIGVKHMKKMGMEFNLECPVQAVEASPVGAKVVCKNKAGETVSFEAEKVLVAIGRKANTASLNLEAAGLANDRGRIIVNDKMETSVPGVYAIGDCVFGKAQLAHTASAMGEVAAENIMGIPAVYDEKTNPTCVYMEPEAASVGLTEEQCKAKGIDYKVGKFPLVANGKSLIINGGEGLVKIIADAKYEEVLGMHIIGPRATDLIAEGALALRLEATVDELISTIHSHPTVSESVRECALNVQKRAIHIKN
ncbi:MULTISPECIES: dihydrolipoyl dehydrogenase [Oscillospiraceae]|uniref:Dihydrolipoyl dehydrogenase n=5 Tax=Dysosmobacter welbionis TaxID=2093857 RepID=A0A4D7B0N7_9FIRM|nr:MULTISPECIES: dihydrolipoyl dehydrogenase [Oscillospiraceae]MCQ5043406.1 dihydrolipoyl dehydrogenase [Dysosmobacter welbionis]MCU6749789.1 dihydrolipoyl dehydrogenase [Oscillibacter acetigenes]QCI60067.1 dihydrolipoyl dehydrogenase [Dysosmobacter welbionis]SCJ51011.1 Dihydrolipoyl dehydrogenase [uncultured Oscillibacter sp.]